ncbi:DUF6531 domain-containing protein [Streptomyces sp. NPDC003435]
MAKDLMKDPAEGFGRLIPDIVLTVATDGGGAAVKGVRIAEDASEASKVRRLVDDVGDGTQKRPDGDRLTDGSYPVDLATGRMFLPQTDVEIPGLLPLVFTRRTESSLATGRFLGPSWTSAVDERLEVDAIGVVHATADGLLITYPHPVPGDATAWLSGIGVRGGHTVTVDRADDGLPLALVHSAGHQGRLTTADGRVTALSLAGGGQDGADLPLVRRPGPGRRRRRGGRPRPDHPDVHRTRPRHRPPHHYAHHRRRPTHPASDRPALPRPGHHGCPRPHHRLWDAFDVLRFDPVSRKLVGGRVPDAARLRVRRDLRPCSGHASGAPGRALGGRGPGLPARDVHGAVPRFRGHRADLPARPRRPRRAGGCLCRPPRRCAPGPGLQRRGLASHRPRTVPDRRVRRPRPEPSVGC